MLGLDLSHLSTGEVEHLLTEQFEDGHVVLTEALTGAARTHNVTDEVGPVLGPLLFQDLMGQRATAEHHRLMDLDPQYFS